MLVIIYIFGGGCSLNGLYVLFVVFINDVFYVIDVGFGDLFLYVIFIILLEYI